MTVDSGRAARYLRILVMLSIIAAGFVMSARADYNIAITPGEITVHVEGDFLQGVPSSLPNTTARSFGSIPAFNGYLSGQNASSLAQSLEQAVNAKTSGAHLAGVSFAANSNSTTMHYDLEFIVSGTSSKTNYAERVNLAWRAFVTEDDFKISSISVNKLFPTYLEQNLVTLANAQSQIGVRVTTRIFLNGESVRIAD